MDQMDIVYTWVDDSFPGYLEELNRYADDPRDLNPNRTRDNLDLIRYSMRSVARNCPWLRRIHLVTCRPQVPPWLDVDHPKINLVHHDRIIAPANLPTYNSFCIVSHLHRIPDVTERFAYLEDDMLVMSPDWRDAMVAADGRMQVHLSKRRVRQDHDPAKASPWNLALATADRALAARFGGGTGRRHVIHGPQLWEVPVAKAMCADFAQAIATTRRSRFRAPDNVPPEFLLQHYAVETGHAVVAPDRLSNAVEGYVSIENFAPITRWELWKLTRRKPLTVTLNDSFGQRPNPRVVAMVRRQLALWFPDPAPWEKPAPLRAPA
ncbi:stealth conserved region 3 domain-containing protein [Psychromarinibacter sp. C21-152]|uniref:Stealth conserved region 3 domain-containing protein n=1 Tax=Psychromarinibacter sediminicola TaxID=3033385 RepID=A0AAE3T773_9RHOB|nr:stealth conserved region 3 domain-containing protein [Psychromarinibacter sediminicola]MDF0600035.1 stealth conserved region 3 domain-containing protein [Psychromarinibacter sediminicola]